jgi:hypothetical protein
LKQVTELGRLLLTHFTETAFLLQLTVAAALLLWPPDVSSRGWKRACAPLRHRTTGCCA